MNKKALIFYISEQTGHFHAACAIEGALLESIDGIEIEKINAFSYTNPILEKIINKAYIELIKKKPELWGNIYDNPDVMKKTKKAREALHRHNMSKIKKLIDKVEPDAIFCTQAFPCGMVADYKRSGGGNVPLVGVLTDYAAHSYWLYDEVDYYVVPSEETASVLKEKGVPAEKVKVYGIPVDPKFRIKHDPERIREKLKLKEGIPTVLVMGGNQGLGAMEDIAKSLFEDKAGDYQLIIVTGSNRRLHTKLKKLSSKSEKENVCLLTYVDNVDELMEISDVVVSKAGGMTIAEAQAKAVPILIVDPIPGHERMNADYLIEKGAAIEITKSSQIGAIVDDLFSKGDLLDRMRASMKALSRPNSALDIAQLVFKKENM